MLRIRIESHPALEDGEFRLERDLELTWRVPPGGHAVLQPDVPYVVNPGAERRIPRTVCDWNWP